MHPVRTLFAITVCLLAAAQPLDAQSRARVAVDSLERRALADSNDATAHYDLAMGYWERKRFDDAERSLRQALALAPQYADAALALGLVGEARGEAYWRKRVKEFGWPAVVEEQQEAGRLYRRAFLLNPLVELRLLGKAKAFRGTLAVVDGRMVIRMAPWYENDLVRAINDFRQGRYERALTRLQELYDDERAGTDAAGLGESVLWHHGLAAAHLGRFEMAVHDFALLTGRAVARENTGSSEGLPLEANAYRFVLATMYFMAGRSEAALQTFHRALEFDLGLYQAHMQVARIHEAAGRWDEAIAAWRSAIDVNGDDPTLEIDLGAALARGGRLDDAATQLIQAADRNPRDARAPYLLALVSRQLGRQDAARQAFARFLAIAPSRFAEQIAEAHAFLSHSNRSGLIGTTDSMPRGDGPGPGIRAGSLRPEAGGD